jgi:hypothetical protein
MLRVQFLPIFKMRYSITLFLTIADVVLQIFSPAILDKKVDLGIFTSPVLSSLPLFTLLVTGSTRPPWSGPLHGSLVLAILKIRP